MIVNILRKQCTADSIMKVARETQEWLFANQQSYSFEGILENEPWWATAKRANRERGSVGGNVDKH